MAMKVGDLVFNVKANTASLQTDLSKANGMFQGFTSSLVGHLSSVTAGLTSAATAAAAYSIKLAASAQSAQSAFKVLLGSSTAAQQMLGKLKDFGAVTPFSFSGLQDNAKLLLAYGLTSEQILPTIKALGDVALGDSEKFNRLATAFGQVAAKGRLMGGEAMQMREAGFNPLEYIAKRTGETMALLEKRMENGGISLREVALAFQDATSEGGRFFGSMDEASKTLEGSFSTLQDSLDEIGRSMGGVLVPALTQLTQETTQWLALVERGAEMSNFFVSTVGASESKEFVNGLSLWVGMIPGASEMMRGLVSTVDGVRAATEKANPEIEKMGEVFADIPKQAELTKEELKDLKKTLDDFDDALKERAKEREKLYKDAERIFERTRTPLERFAKEIADAQALFNDGWLSSDTFDRELKRMEAELASFNEAAIQGNSAKREYSAEAFTSLERSRRENIFGEEVKEQVRLLRRQVELTERIATAAEKEKTPAVKHVKGRF